MNRLIEELEKVKEEREELSSTLATTIKRAQIEKEELEYSWKRKYEELDHRYHKEKEEARGRESSLETQLKSVEAFRLREEEVDKELEQWRIKYQKLENELYNTRNRAQLELNRRLEELSARHAQEIEKIRVEARIQAEEDVRNSGNFLQLENSKLNKDLSLHQKELDILKRERTELMEINRSIRRDHSLNEEGVIEYQNLNMKQSTKIKKLKEKLEYLKGMLASEVARYTKELETVKVDATTRISDLEKEVLKLREYLRVRTKELKTVKALSQMILDQRSDIETFFLEALDQVREEIKKKHSARKIGGGGNQPLRLPDIAKTSGSYSEVASKLGKEKVDIAELDWEDRERVLRILFSKINSGTHPMPWRDVDKSVQRKNLSLEQSKQRTLQNEDRSIGYDHQFEPSQNNSIRKTPKQVSISKEPRESEIDDQEEQDDL
eukprot:TRINITY_DN10504_c0_g1_i1.p1 TRINITY_DN10504_c0_g1~~TRINITY_DN10504_c0_g1_i1.p1  ORF type:complete len:439 (-),score=135.84 TRINITY_DN10504_c0_g1_i1:162-1478(-)